jgi:glycerate-2-kinase
MTEEPMPKGTIEKYMEQVMKLAVEAGQMLDKTMNQLETSSKEFVRAVDREAEKNVPEIRRMTNEIIGDVKKEIPKVQAELKEMEARARQKLREFEEK